LTFCIAGISHDPSMMPIRSKKAVKIGKLITAAAMRGLIRFL